MVIQLFMGAAILYALWWVVTFGVFHKGVEAFSHWYVTDVAPSFAAGTSPVLVGSEFTNGFFAPRPEPPASLTWNGPAAMDYLAQYGG
ncbi:hypothetical protein [Demequina soli]|uniref:hypothetical protein n=1 Tax=Demequina soli TaxID=1638987 RepID=UPI00078600C5|nr:hypothetical protein [Demequina soli]